FVVRYRVLVVLFWIVVLVVSTKTLPSLGSEVNNDNSQFLPASAASSRAANLASPILGNFNTQSQISIVAEDTRGPLTLADEQALAREVTLAGRVPRVLSARAVAVSRDGHAAQLVVEARVNQADVATQKTIVDNIRATFSKIGAPSALALHLAGPVATNVANQNSANKAGSRTQLFSLIFIVILLLFIFRSLLAPILTLLPAAFALGISTRFIGGLGAHGLKISEITSLLLIVLLLGAGTDYGLFLVFRVREEIRAGREAKAAVEHSLVRVGESISASAGTVMFALLSLLLASFGIYQDLGIPLALGIAVILIAGLTLLPALLAIFGKAVFWPAQLTPEANREGTWGRLAARLVQQPARTLALGVLVFAGLSLAALGYHSGGFGGALNAPAGTDAAAGNAIVSRHFPQSNVNPANAVFRYPKPIWDDPSEVSTAETVLLSSRQFHQLAGPFNPNGSTIGPSAYSRLHAELGSPRLLAPIERTGLPVPSAEYNAYRSTALFVSPDGRTISFEVTLAVGGQQTTAALDATPHIRAIVTTAASRSGATASGLAGEAAAIYDVSSASNHDLSKIIPIAILAIAILLALVLRSLIAPLYLIVSVGLSYLAALGVATLVFIDIGGSGGLTFILPFLMFIFLLALGEDYNILVMTRIREEAGFRSLRDAVVRAVGRTGPTVSSAGVVLAGTFGILAISAGSGPGAGQIRDVGVGLAVGILMDTFLVRTLLVPSTVALLGRWNWWPARMGRGGTEHSQSAALEAEPIDSAAPVTTPS
ncbi:MAG TPA: MMPL family transporter, partial [Acidimicrobiales bacterium]|nr:MMPL family transporter [Acidimicrobiales bacterium]